MHKWSIFLVALIIGSLACKTDSNEIIEGNLSIFPLPASMQPGNGFLLIDEKIKILTDSSNFPHYNPFKIFNDVLEKKSG